VLVGQFAVKSSRSYLQIGLTRGEFALVRENATAVPPRPIAAVAVRNLNNEARMVNG
jgi:hypothetical protein